jgi:DNA topoisomerase-1
MGRHAAPRDETFDQRERETAGAHRADVEPLGPAPAKKKAAPVKKAPAKKAPARAAKQPATKQAAQKKAGKR